MKKRFVILALTLSCIVMSAIGQPTKLELTFTAVDNEAYVQLDSIKIMNLNWNIDTVLFWPDTVLAISFVSIPERTGEKSDFQVFPNHPNPLIDQTTIPLYVPKKDKVRIIVTDILGRMVIQTERVLDQGKHTFIFTPGTEDLYLFTAQWQGHSSTIKMLRTGPSSGGKASLDYIGGEDYTPHLKSDTEIIDFFFVPGDELLYIGYAGNQESGILDNPEESTSYTFQFATNISCPGTPTVEYEGQVYNTIQIFSQCWLKENLNVGTMIDGTMEQNDNGTIEKYCYNNETDSCTKYGGLYQWDEMMQYTTQEGVQGICPPGWHLPSDEEWKVLEGAVDSQFGIGDPVWEEWWSYRGYDAGMNMKSTTGWWEGASGSDPFGFSALPAGYREIDGTFQWASEWTGWWSTWIAGDTGAWGRFLYAYFTTICRSDYIQDAGFSVRCLKDD
jgi:uncharacterized protein (TIGR02145 family)